jgi:hypothetical protein
MIHSAQRSGRVVSGSIPSVFLVADQFVTDCNDAEMQRTDNRPAGLNDMHICAGDQCELPTASSGVMQRVAGEAHFFDKRSSR